MPCCRHSASYTIEKKLAGPNADPPFGKGNVRGVAAPESANNAGSQTSFIPMLTLGIPPNAVMALMIGAMTIHNIQPGPQVMTSNPALFWGLIASMWVGNLMLVILNLPMIGVWIQVLKVPYRLLYPAILVFCCIGVYSINNTSFDVYVTVVFGALGYLFYKLGCEPAPLILGFILGPMMEENLRRAMLLSRGDPTTFLTRPLSLGLLLVAAGAARHRLAAGPQGEARGGVPGSRLSAARSRQRKRPGANRALSSSCSAYCLGAAQQPGLGHLPGDEIGEARGLARDVRRLRGARARGPVDAIDCRPRSATSARRRPCRCARRCAPDRPCPSSRRTSRGSRRSQRLTSSDRA